MKEALESLRRRFEAKLEWAGGCRLWTGHVERLGYGTISVPSELEALFRVKPAQRRKGSAKGWTKVFVHRVAYFLEYGRLDDELFVLHRCDIRLCTYGDHLFQGDAATNMADRDAKGRQARGTRINTCRLSAEAVVEIRARCAAGESFRAVARQFGVQKSSVSRIVRGIYRRAG